MNTQPPERTQAWMDRLTVEHEYDPETGFIVARETIGLPSVLANGPDLSRVLGAESDATNNQLVVVFATADRCAPCQQYKKDAINDGRVVALLEDERVLATHVEVDRQADAADRFLGSRGIPMTYAYRGGERVSMLRGQRSADELLAWLETQLAGG